MSGLPRLKPGQISAFKIGNNLIGHAGINILFLVLLISLFQFHWIYNTLSAFLGFEPK